MKLPASVKMLMNQVCRISNWLWGN